MQITYGVVIPFHGMFTAKSLPLIHLLRHSFSPLFFSFHSLESSSLVDAKQMMCCIEMRIVITFSRFLSLCLCSNVSFSICACAVFSFSIRMQSRYYSDFK